MIFGKIIILGLVSLLSIDQCHALVEIDAKVQMRLDNALNKMYLKGPHGLQVLAAHQNASSKNITEEDINDIEEEKGLHTYENVLVYINMHIGSNQEPYTILFDTGSTWLFLSSRLCENCDRESGALFDERNSTTFSFYPVVVDLHYGSGSVYGLSAYDKVCLQPNRTCADSFQFMAVSHMAIQSTLPVSGLLGMSPRGGGQKMLLDEMKLNGAIDQRVFSIYIDWDNMNSKISFGGYDLAKYAHPDHQSLNYVTLINPFNTDMWFIPFDGMKMIPPKNSTAEQQKLYDSMEIYANSILIDSGTTFLLLPYNERNKIVDAVNKINPAFKCTYGQVSICNCNSSADTAAFPDIQFMIGDRKYYIPVEDYVIYDSTEGKCYNTLLTVQGLNFYIMGLNFFKNYYTVFDREGLRIGFTVSKHASSRVLQLTEEYDKAKNTSKQSVETSSLSEEEMQTLQMAEFDKTSSPNWMNSMKLAGLENEKIVDDASETYNGENKFDTIIKVILGFVLSILMVYFGSMAVKKKEKVVQAQGEYVVM